MKSVVTLIAVAAALLLAHPAFARVSANPGPPHVLNPEAGRLTQTQPYAAPAGAQAVQAINVPLAAGATQLDSVWYDLQDFGSLGTRIIVADDGTVHVVWQDDFCELDPAGCPPDQSKPQPYPQRGMAYAYKPPGGAWTHVGKVQDPSIRNCCASELYGGFGTISMTPDGRATISQHMNEDGCDLRGDFYVERAVAGNTWKAYLGPIVSPNFLFPQIVSLANGSFTLLAEQPKTGQYDEVLDFRISRLGAEGANFVCPTGWQNGPWTSVAPSTLYRDGKPAFPCIAKSSNGRVGIAVGDFGGNVYLIESSDGTFAPATITIRNLTNTTDAQVTAADSTSNQYRAYVHCGIAYNDTTPNVVWSELQGRRVSGSVQFFDWHSRIRHWDSIHGATTVKQVQAGEADSYDNIDNGLNGPLCGINHITVDWPQVGFSVDGSETYVAWLRFVDGEVDPTATEGLSGICTGTGFGDIALSLSKDGVTWSAPQNLTNTPQTDERYFSLAARNPDGRAHLIYQCSATNEAGSAVFGDRGTVVPNILRRIAYLEVPIVGTAVGVGDGPTASVTPALRLWPNPARNSVTFALSGALGSVARGGTVEVLSAEGRLVARVPVSAGAPALWNGLDRNGRRAASGLYFARVQGAPAGSAGRFLFLH